MSAKTAPLPPVVVTRMEVRLAPEPGGFPQEPWTVAQISLEGGQWVLELLPGQTYKPEGLAKMDGRWATKATTVDEARETLAEAAHALVAMLDAQAAERQAFMRRINKATGERQATLPLGEHDPLDDREPAAHLDDILDADTAIQLGRDREPAECTCGNEFLHARECPRSGLQFRTTP